MFLVGRRSAEVVGSKMSSAKLLENPNLHQQIGCMTGIFQIFDREISHKTVPSCLVLAYNGKNEKHRGVSTESTSIATFSSSSSNQDPNDFQSVDLDNKLRFGEKSQIRPPGVVAKLMGLEPFPDFASQKENYFTKKPWRTVELQHILDAIQSNCVSEDKVSIFVSPKSAESRRRYGCSPIVIMKPAKIVERHSLLRSSSGIAVCPLLNLQKFEENNSNGESNSRRGKTRSSPRNNMNKSTSSIVPNSMKKKKLQLPPTLSKSKRSESENNVSLLKMEGEIISSVKTLKLRKDKPRSEHATRSVEHPSPVSVLDLSEYTDDELTTINQELHSLKDHSTDRSTTANWREPPLMTPQKLHYINHLLQNLINLNPNHDEEHTDYIASLCENPRNSDHKYIAEILVISGLLLTDLNSVPFKLHPSGHPINPDLFFVLEKMNVTCLKLNEDQKIHRRIIFDNVNEILLEKLGFAGNIVETRVRSKRVVWTARKLLKELCFEIDQLEAKEKSNVDVYERWDECRGEVYVMVLGIERLIFKEIVSEVLIERNSGSVGPIMFSY